MLPTFYQAHLQKQLTHAQFMLLTILLDIIQSEKQVRFIDWHEYFLIQLLPKAAVANYKDFLIYPN